MMYRREARRICLYPVYSDTCSCVRRVCYYPTLTDSCQCQGGHGAHGSQVSQTLRAGKINDSPDWMHVLFKFCRGDKKSI